MRVQSFAAGVLFTFANPGTSEHLLCSQNFGAPRAHDCYSLLQTLPTGSAPQMFEEEQLRLVGTSWPEVMNLFPRPIEQLPKYWSLG